MNVYLLSLALIFLAGVDAGARLNSKKSRGRRSSLSISESSGVKWTIDFIVPVIPLLNTTNTYVTWDFSLFTTIPTRTQVAELYNSLATLSEEKEVDMDHDFIEELGARLISVNKDGSSTSYLLQALSMTVQKGNIISN